MATEDDVDTREYPLAQLAPGPIEPEESAPIELPGGGGKKPSEAIFHWMVKNGCLWTCLDPHAEETARIIGIGRLEKVLRLKDSQLTRAGHSALTVPAGPTARERAIEELQRFVGLMGFAPDAPQRLLDWCVEHEALWMLTDTYADPVLDLLGAQKFFALAQRRNRQIPNGDRRLSAPKLKRRREEQYEAFRQFAETVYPRS